MSYFVLFSLFRFTLVIKLRKFDVENYWNTLTFCDKKNDVRYEYVLSSSSWFCLSFVAFAQF